ncbi:hypothetical protein FEM48_Zijuj09G0212900 [Ziziphus jujuba var. spinosa]|uniref:Uncharacterized protein n=1 Tax=Ziziphus jujuba var. spinosa TaxID=714518 RepID=A0A978UVC9_ZIZJJ|nr:hypothetical protein FEM48_Zijuj09G0212900 [Ziziphus jujuba var. spinosa]
MGTQENLAIDLSQNHFEGPLPLVSSKVYELDLSDNLLSGSISQFLCSSPSEPMNMAALYLANNQLSGKLPNCWSKWNNTQTTEGAYYSYEEAALLLMKGKLIEYNKTLGLVNIIDLSGNSLSGHIPLEITSLSNLLSLNLSNNLLDGEIPMKIGFWGFCGSLIFNRTWRHSYFRFLDCIKDQIYVASVLKLRWFRETITSLYTFQMEGVPWSNNEEIEHLE